MVARSLPYVLLVLGWCLEGFLSMKRAAIILFSFTTAAVFSIQSAEATITYRINNHPDGGQISGSETVDSGGYVLRLDIWEQDNRQVNTFNANHTDLFFSFEPGGTTATIHGSVTHNESGIMDSYEAGDDVWDIEIRMDMTSTFDDVLLTDGGTPWYGGNDDDKTFDDMIADLLANGEDGDNDSNDETSSGFSEDVARIYFEMSGFSLSPQSLNPEYDGPRDWDEYPNPPARKPFFIQYGWRLDGGDDRLGAAGWLEPFIEPALPLHHDQNNNRRCCQDFIFVFGERQFMPEPASGTLMLLAAVAMIGAIGRRRRRR